jgi:serine protease AprX
VVRAHPGELSALTAELGRLGVHPTATISLIDAVVVPLMASTASSLATDPLVAEVTADGPVQLESGSYDPTSDPNSLYNAAAMVGAHDAWSRGYTGQGVDVALIDSGVTPVTGLADPSQVVNGPDLSLESQSTATRYLDTFGHGTFMAGLIAGRDPGVDADPANRSAYQGIAPDARIVNVKVADALGRSDVSQVIAGIDWVVQHAHDGGLDIRVLNLSFGTNSLQPYQLDPLAYAAEVAWHSGIVVVVSAGNDGGNRLVDPAIDPFVIAVGALDTNGSVQAQDASVASFSNRGTRGRRVDVVAPGVHVEGLRVPGSFIDSTFATTGRLGDRFFRGSGTSQATAITSGVVALMLSENPALTPDQVKHLLLHTAQPLQHAEEGGGFGVPDATDAMDAAPGPAISQHFRPADGTGSLEAARGGRHVTLGGVPLVGEVDIFGNPVDTSALATAEAGLTSWVDGSWNGSAWTGASWTGASWAGASWAGASWAGASWAGASWSGASWSGASWSGASWDGASWDGASWDGASWDGASWDGASWDSSAWMSGTWS